MREVPCADLRRSATAPGIAGGDGRRQEHRRAGSRADRRGVGDPRLSSQLSAREALIAERVLKEIRARLQFLVDVGLDYLTLDRSAAHPRRRGGAADPPGEPDRQRPGRRALRARRALDRPAPAGQPAAHRDARAPAGPRQHRHRRRARRGDDPGRGPRRRHRAGRGRARRGDRLLRRRGRAA